MTAEETRARLLAAAAAAFEARGLEGTRVADIADDAGVSKGAMYGHFRSKAELLSASLRDHGSEDLAGLFADGRHVPVVDLLVAFGDVLLQHPASKGALVVEALVAARRDDEVAAVMTGHLHQRLQWLEGLIADGQRDGEIDGCLSAAALARFCTMLVVGAALLPAAGLPPVDPAAWSALITRVGEAVRPRTSEHEEAP